MSPSTTNRARPKAGATMRAFATDSVMTEPDC